MEDDYLSARTIREAKRFLQVTFADGRTICYKSATQTFMEVLRSIDVERLQDIDPEIGHLPMISQECYPKYKGYMKEFRRGWFVNTQSNTDQKYIQLLAISDKLNLGLKVQIGADLEADKSKGFSKSKKKDDLLVKFPDGNYVGEESPLQTFISCVEKIGIDALKRKDINVNGKELITFSQQSRYQQQLSNGMWVTIPNSTKDKAKVLKIIGIMMGVKLEVTVI